MLLNAQSGSGEAYTTLEEESSENNMKIGPAIQVVEMTYIKFNGFDKSEMKS